jgi:Xaa-Pro aminopeptidase
LDFLHGTGHGVGSYLVSITADETPYTRKSKPSLHKCWRANTSIAKPLVPLGNTAMSIPIVYKPEKGSCAIIDPSAIYLCDSGCQYFDGTTDTTRNEIVSKERPANRSCLERICSNLSAPSTSSKTVFLLKTNLSTRRLSWTKSTELISWNRSALSMICSLVSPSILRRLRPRQSSC